MKTCLAASVPLAAMLCLGSCQDPDAKARMSLTPADSIRVAVVPFGTVGDSGGRYFGIGLAAEVERSLQSEPGITVRSWSQVDTLATRGRPLPEDSMLIRLGTELHVTHILGGTTRRDGTRTEIAVRLIRVSDRLALWSGTYWRETAQMQPLPSEMSADIAAALKGAPKLR